MTIRRGRRTRLAVAAAILVATGGLTATFVSSGGKGSASAATSLEQYVPIESVVADVVVPKPQGGASTGRFTVDCGTNGNGKFSPDNPVAQPGIKNGAEHLHDFVGNLAITADTSDEALAASGTTCRNGDRSAYFWPVVRIDKSVRPGAPADGSAGTIACPNVKDRLPAVPSRARAEVTRQLRALDRLTADAGVRMAAHQGPIDARFNESVAGPLRSARAAIIQRIVSLLTRAGSRPRGMTSMADCEVSYDGMHAGHTTSAGATASPTVQCPSVRDKLAGVPQPAVAEVNRNLDELDRQTAEANERLVNARGAADPDFARNAIVGPLTAKRTATIDRIATAIGRPAAEPAGLDALAACTVSAASAPSAPTASTPPSAAAALPDPSGPNFELPGNTGGIVRPAAVTIEYRGNATGKVVPMPKFLRALTGDAKPTSRGPANARASWTCSGFGDRRSDKYPICPEGSKVMRVQDFPGCWDGKNIDSANHRSHLAFADATSGACPAGFVAIPQLRISISYAIPRAVQLKGQFALDSFPEENHNPFSDHNDFVNVNSDRTMRTIASCLNTGRRCA
jgi:hypothetical protein